MQEIFGFLGLVIVISASGVMSPGPLFAANVMYGLREGKISGIKMAIRTYNCRISFDIVIRNRIFFY